MDNRFYLQALGITGLFIGLLIIFWIASGGQAASQAEVESANSTRTAIAMTGSYLLQPRTRTPVVITMTAAPAVQTSVPIFTVTPASLPSATGTSLLPQLNTPVSPVAPSATNTSLLPQFNTPITPVVPSVTNTALFPQFNTPAPPTFTPLPPLPTQTAMVQVPVLPTTASAGRVGSRSPASVPQGGIPAAVQDPAEFARWYFARVTNERDYQNLWDNYLTISYKANVGSGLFEDYVWWWNSVDRVEVHSVDVLANNGSDALVRVHLSFYMKDGRVVEDQVYDYDFLYDHSRNTWMFDSSG